MEPIMFVELPAYGPEPGKILLNLGHVISVHGNGSSHTKIRTTHTDVTVGCSYEDVMRAFGMANEAMQP